MRGDRNQSTDRAPIITVFVRDVFTCDTESLIPIFKLTAAKHLQGFFPAAGCRF